MEIDLIVLGKSALERSLPRTLIFILLTVVDMRQKNGKYGKNAQNP